MGIVLKNINKKFNIHTSIECTVLKDISLEIPKGKMIAIKGRSGAGKSTLLHIIGCLDTPTSGSYYLDDENIVGLSNKKIAEIRNKRFGFVMQDFGLINDDSVYFNVALPLILSNHSSDVTKKLVDKSLKSLGISHLSRRMVEGLSGGEKQRVAIARAIANDPDYILADEPTGALDIGNAEKIMQVLKEIHKRGKTVLIITHDDSISLQCETCITISDGQLDKSLSGQS